MGPTSGARDDRVWQPRSKVAFAIRAVALLVPVLAALLAIRLVGSRLYRPTGSVGALLWVLQAGAVGAIVSRVVDTVTRRLLPLAVLFNLSLVFPDRAPSRFGVALRAGTLRRLRASARELAERGLGDDEGEAARRAIEMVVALGRHDRLTRGHTERVRAYADLIGAEMGLDRDDRNRLAWGVILHDVGKMSVPPEILNKPGRPTEEEWKILAGHPAAGARMLAPLAEWLGEWCRAAGEHHERWDGTGYPDGLAGTEISLAGRIAAVADAFDVITSKRSYKNAMTNVAARRELVRCSGTQFDPTVVRAFLNVSLGRRRPVGGAAWIGDTTLWGGASTATTGITAAASVSVALGTGAVAAAPASDHSDRPVRIEAATEGVERLADAAPPEHLEPATDAVSDVSIATPGVGGRAAPPAPADRMPRGAGDETPDGPTVPTTVAPSRLAPTPTRVAPTTTLASTVPTATVPPTTVPPRPSAPLTPIVDDLVQPLLDDVVEPLVDDVVEPLVDDVVDDVVEPLVDDVVEPLVDDVVEPLVEPVVDEVGGLIDETLDGFPLGSLWG